MDGQQPLDMYGQPVEGMVEPPPPKKKKGCFFWGCLTLIILLVALGGCLSYGYYRLVLKITSDTPTPIPRYEVKPGEYEAIQERFNRFAEAAKEEKPAELVLTADDLNAFLTKSPDLEKVAGMIHVKIEDEDIILDMSLPVSEVFGLPFTKGRYLNASIRTGLAVDDGRLSLTPRSGIVNEWKLPEEFLDSIADSVNDAIRQSSDKELKNLLQKVGSVEIRDGKVYVKR